MTTTMTNLGQQLRENLQLLLERRLFHENEVAAIDQYLLESNKMLADLGAKPVVRKPATTQPVLPSSGDIKERTLSYLREAKEAVTVDNIAIYLLQNGYETTLEEQDFINFLYNEAINQLIREGLVVAVDEDNVRKYLLK